MPAAKALGCAGDKRHLDDELPQRLATDGLIVSRSQFSITDNNRQRPHRRGQCHYLYGEHSGEAPPDGTVEHYTLTGRARPGQQSDLRQRDNQRGQATIAVNTLANVLGGSNPTLTLSPDRSGRKRHLPLTRLRSTRRSRPFASGPTSVNEGSWSNRTVSTSGVAGSLVAGSVESYTLSGNPRSLADSGCRSHRIHHARPERVRRW